MQSPMPLTTGAATALLSTLSVTASPPLPSTVASTSPDGFLKRIAKPQALGPCFPAKSAANESGVSLTRKFTPFCRYTVIGRDLCLSTAVKPIRLNRPCSSSARPAGAANSTNSKPSIPIGFSNVVTCMPRLGWAFMALSCLSVHDGRHKSVPPSEYLYVIVSYETICKEHRRNARQTSACPRHRRACPAAAGALPAVSAVDPVQHDQPDDCRRLSAPLRHLGDRVAGDGGTGALRR